MKKNDFILFALLTVAVLIGFCIRSSVFSEKGSEITVTCDGRPAGVYSLSSDTEVTFTGETGGSNTLRIADGMAYMIGADCPDKLCMRQKAISGKGESIICLPHRLVVEVTKGESKGADAVAQ